MSALKVDLEATAVEVSTLDKTVDKRAGLSMLQVCNAGSQGELASQKDLYEGNIVTRITGLSRTAFASKEQAASCKAGSPL